ncbi:unnamed protein product [Thlaspi arvense]|uniref:FBD domain-containing protein n=1 Tax=Thlaspi arvense TaxID=13288 RepID=A0AAU9SG45_THLAR|nr:unnamed protein product [Thlaspi arvense]
MKTGSMVHKLEFDSHNQELQKFSVNVVRFLLSHKAPVVESFHFKVEGPLRSIDIGIWTGILSARHLRELELNLSRGFTYRLSVSLLCSNTLETLKLQGPLLVDVSSPVCMKSLRTLHLVKVTYKDDKSVGNLLSSFPNLEHLIVHRGRHKSLVTFNIVAPFLKTLSIVGLISGVKGGGYVINAPSLKYLDIKRLSCYQFCLIENASELVGANIRGVYNTANEMILESLKSVKRLSLGLTPLHQHAFTKTPMEVGDHWNQSKNVPHCLLSHLETFVWTRYDWERQEELQVGKYILMNARRLKRATFSTRPIGSNELDKLEERCKMLKELDCLSRASDSCHFVFESE